jgi:hypothetical protein
MFYPLISKEKNLTETYILLCYFQVSFFTIIGSMHVDHEDTYRMIFILKVFASARGLMDLIYQPKLFLKLFLILLLCI